MITLSILIFILTFLLLRRLYKKKKEDEYYTLTDEKFMFWPTATIGCSMVSGIIIILICLNYLP